ncbi:MAG: DEAD/DEAH box helicase, partial [Desulfovibrionaceae bacterium]|nr:DEAD/DEAH box helicase [Desulfovibrionaceae bacterium]
MTFESFSFDRRISAGIRNVGFTTPTPIQARAIPPVLAGRDVMGLAQTGTGKTAAFALPILQRLLDAEAAPRGPVRVLVLAPTRELAVQIHQTFVDLGRQTGLRSAAVFGGVGLGRQSAEAAKATILTACPGRLLDLVARGAVNLGHADTLVLDEADRMLDMGFLPDIRKILARLPRERQNLMFSATMPQEIRTLSESILCAPEVVQVGRSAPAALVRQSFYPVAQHQKQGLLESLLQTTDHDAVLVFTRTKHRAKTLAHKLAARGWAATSLQGNLSQNRRQEALDGFKRGDYRIMVATDIAARGIDCERVSHVINFDMPDTVENYTHRIGRTGRAERTGEALTLVTGEDQPLVRAIERTLGERVERRRLQAFDYEAEARGAAATDDDARAPRSCRPGQTGRPGRPARPARESRDGGRTRAAGG